MPPPYGDKSWPLHVQLPPPWCGGTPLDWCIGAHNLDDGAAAGRQCAHPGVSASTSADAAVVAAAYAEGYSAGAAAARTGVAARGVVSDGVKGATASKAEQTYRRSKSPAKQLAREPAPCKWFMRGTCKFGADCRFGHEPMGCGPESSKEQPAQVLRPGQQIRRHSPSAEAQQSPFVRAQSPHRRGPAPLALGCSGRGRSHRSSQCEDAESPQEFSIAASHGAHDECAEQVKDAYPEVAQDSKPLWACIPELQSQTDNGVRPPRLKRKPARGQRDGDATSSACRGSARSQQPQVDVNTSPRDHNGSSSVASRTAGSSASVRVGSLRAAPREPKGSCQVVWCDQRAFKEGAVALKSQLEVNVCVPVKAHKTAEKCIRLLQKKRRTREKSEVGPLSVYLVSWANAPVLVPYLTETPHNAATVLVLCDLCSDRGVEAAQRWLQHYPLVECVVASWNEAILAVVKAIAVCTSNGRSA